jgi:hypothetical protein
MKKYLCILTFSYCIYLAGYGQTITGTGTTTTLPKFTGTSTVGNSQIIDNGTTIGIGGGTIPGTNSPKLYSYGPGSYFDIPNNVSYQGNGKAMFKINRPSTSFENFLSFCEAGANKWAIGMDDEASGNFYITGNPAGTVMTLTTSGNVGIGTTSPSTKLHVTGSSTFDGIIKFPTISNVDFGGGTSGNYTVLLRDNNNQIVRTSIGNIASTSYIAGPPDLDPSLCLTLWDPVNCTSSYSTTPTWKNIAGSGNVFVTCANVGIGTSTPSYSLDVSGSGRIVGNIGIGAAPRCTTKLFAHSTNTTDEFLRFENTNGTQLTVNNSGRLSIGSETNGDRISLGHDINTNTLFTDGTAYVGLNAQGESDGTFTCNSIGGKNGAGIIWGTSEGSINFSLIGYGGANTSVRTFQSVRDNAIMRMMWNSTNYSSQVLIGNWGPNAGPHLDYKLAVDGKLIAKEIFVTISNWPDYVFDPNYELLSIDSLDQFIKTNKHLPNVPTAEEMEQVGVNAGESNRILLEKIEELTLYIIEQNKSILQQNNRIEELEKKVNNGN